MLRLFVGLILILLNVNAYSAQQNSVSSSEDQMLEKRVLSLTEELRCLVCQNQTIADSHAGLAIDLKNQVREKLIQGATDQEVLDYMVQRYGDFVLYRPPVKNTTLLLWFGPFLMLLIGIAFLIWKLIRPSLRPVELSESERLHAAELLVSVSRNKDYS